MDKEYNHNASKFIEGESKKAKDGEGYFAQKEEILKLDDLYRLNINIGKQEKKDHDKFKTNITDNNTQGNFYYDANTGSRVLRGKAQDNRDIYYTNTDWANHLDQSLALDENGVLQKGLYNSTYATGALEKETLSLIGLAASSPEVSKQIYGDGSYFQDETNRGTLRDEKKNSYFGLAGNVVSLYSKQAQNELRNESDAYADNHVLNPDMAKGKSKDEQRSLLKQIFVMSKINPAAHLMERYSQVIGGKVSNNNGGGSGSSDKPQGPIAAFLSKDPTLSMTRDKELRYNEGGYLIQEPNTKLLQIKPLNESLKKSTNDAYYESIYSNRGSRVTDFGKYFWDQNGVPNNMDIFRGKDVYVYSVNTYKTNHKPVAVPGTDADGNPKEDYVIPSTTINGKKFDETPEYTQVVTVAIHKDDIGVLKNIKSIDKGKIVPGALSKSNIGNKGEHLSIGPKGSETDYYLMDIEVPIGAGWTNDSNIFLPNNSVNSNKDAEYVVQKDKNKSQIVDNSTNLY